LIFHLKRVKKVIELLEWFEQEMIAAGLDPEDARPSVDRTRAPDNRLDFGHELALSRGGLQISWSASYPTAVDPKDIHGPGFIVYIRFPQKVGEEAHISLDYYTVRDTWEVRAEVAREDPTVELEDHFRLAMDFARVIHAFHPRVPEGNLDDFNLRTDLNSEGLAKATIQQFLNMLAEQVN